ncbi:MAG: chloride channel protein [Veillonellales bacterium]
MTKKWLEQTTLLISITKWTLYASILGAIVGGCTVLFLTLLNNAITMLQALPYPFLLAPAALVASKLLIDKLAPEAAGYGTDRLIAAVQEKNGQVPLRVVPVKLIASILTITAGGSAGKIGPCGQIGAGLASSIANNLKIDTIDKKKLVVCGISAGFAAVLGTPVGGALFGAEVLFLGRLLYEVLFPAFIAGLTAYQIANLCGIPYFYQKIETAAALSGWNVLQCILLGILCGLTALFFIESLEFVKNRFADRKSSLLQPISGGLLLILLGWFVSPDYLGLSMNTIQQSLQGLILAPYAFLAKIIATSITFAAGGSGGIILPTLFIGSAAGNLFAQILGGNHLAFFAAIGMVALLAAATNTPIASTVIAMELFGPAIAPYAAVACAVSYLAIGHNSIFPTQVLATRKSASLEIATGKPIQAIHDVVIHPHGSFWKILFYRLHLIKHPSPPKDNR